jgi:hypothetical protein
MPCPSLRLAMSQALPSSPIRDSKVAGHSSPLSAGAVPETYVRVQSASAAGCARDCRRSSARAAVMQVRPLSVVSGTAGFSRFGCSPFGRLGWL